jgi:hypothetical protein
MALSSHPRLVTAAVEELLRLGSNMIAIDLRGTFLSMKYERGLHRGRSAADLGSSNELTREIPLRLRRGPGGKPHRVRESVTPRQGNVNMVAASCPGGMADELGTQPVCGAAGQLEHARW